MRNLLIILCCTMISICSATAQETKEKTKHRYLGYDTLLGTVGFNNYNAYQAKQVSEEPVFNKEINGVSFTFGRQSTENHALELFYNDFDGGKSDAMIDYRAVGVAYVLSTSRDNKYSFFIRPAISSWSWHANSIIKRIDTEHTQTTFAKSKKNAGSGLDWLLGTDIRTGGKVNIRVAYYKSGDISSATEPDFIKGISGVRIGFLYKF